MARLILFNKPYGVLSQFRQPTGTEDYTPTLADHISLPGFYPAGRLDKDSEGLLLLTDDGKLQERISSPRHKLPKTYYVQLEGELEPHAVDQLARGVELKDGPTRPAQARAIEDPGLPARIPPVRHRETVPTSWLALTITEGRNRQVRRMTAAVGLPTLRLFRYSIGSWTCDGLAPGEWREEKVHLPKR